MTDEFYTEMRTSALKWYEITIYTTEEATEAIADYLHGLGAGGVSIEESGSLNRPRDTSLGQWYEMPLNDIPEGEAEMKAYFSQEGADITELVEQVTTFVASLHTFGLDAGKAEITWREVDEEDWAHGWKKYYKPLKVSDRLTIKPTWEPYEASHEELVIELDPGMAFGTGTHPTTMLCLRMLEKVVRAGDDVIDVGTGSGILAIAAAKLGARHVLALDLDPVAVSSTEGNVELNGLSTQVTVKESDLLTIVQQAEREQLGIRLPVQLVVSNILAEIIMTFTRDVYDVLQTGGRFVASGIIKEKQSLVIQNLQEVGFVIESQAAEDDWSVIVARKV